MERPIQGAASFLLRCTQTHEFKRRVFSSEWLKVQGVSRRTNAQGEGDSLPSSTQMKNSGFGHAKDLKFGILYCLLFSFVILFSSLLIFIF